MVLTWEAPETSALPVVTYAVERKVGEGQYKPAGRTEAPRLVQQVDDLPDQQLKYRVAAEDEKGNLGAFCESSTIKTPATFGISLRFTGKNFSGTLRHLSKDGILGNPHTAGVVEATMSSIRNGDPARFVEHAHAQPVCNDTANMPDWWMAVDLKGARLVPDHYELRSDKCGGAKPRHWELQASDDGRRWATLRSHSGDEGLSDQPMSVAHWPLDAAVVARRAFRHFRIVQTGKDSSGDDNLSCAGIELYGLLLGA